MRVGKVYSRALEKKGYVPISVAAARIGFDVVTIGRWIDEGHIKAVRVAGMRFVEWATVVAHVGADAVRLITGKEGG